jgi:hypothetical protein
MAELTALESKIGEVLGLAMAAQGATEQVGKLVEKEGEHDDLKQALGQMHEEAKEAEKRTTSLAEDLDGKKTAILERARETKQEATEMMSTYLGDDADALDGFEFLTMAEAGEVGHWRVVRTMNERANLPGLQELVDWQIPIQQRHLEQTLTGSVELAADEDPNEPA